MTIPRKSSSADRLNYQSIYKAICAMSDKNY